MSVQTGKGATIPAWRRDDAILIRDWLETRLNRPLAPAEAQTFGRMAHDRYASEHHRQPYTMRVGRKHSQTTAYLPEDEPLLIRVLADYRRTDCCLDAESAA